MAKAKERNVYPKDEFWKTIADWLPDRALEREILFSYCEILTPNQQKWLLYTFWEGLSIKEIAELEKVTVSAVKQWRTGAREKIKVVIMN